MPAPAPLRALASVRDRLLTPALVVDLDAVEHNVRAMIARVGTPTRWRPHLKTVKQTRIVASLLAAGVARFKVATPDELAVALLAAGGAPVSVLVAYPLQPPHVRAVLGLARAHPNARVSVLADSPAHLAQLAESLGEADVGIFVDVDLGMGRTGTPPLVWSTLARSRGLAFPARGLVGLHGYDGHHRFADRDLAFAGYDRLCELADELSGAERRRLEIVTSGTHSYAHALAHSGLCSSRFDAQVSPGTVLLSDRRSHDAAADLGLRQAAFVATRVVSERRDGATVRITLDAGSKAVTPDTRHAASCEVVEHPELRPLRASEEHLPCEVVGDTEVALGDLLLLVPDHVCTTVNLHREAVYVRGDAYVGTGTIEAAGRRPFAATLGLAALLGLSSIGCTTEREMAIGIILPEDRADLEQVDNVSLVLSPGGLTETFAVDGLDFELQVVLAPDDELHELSVYLAEGEELLAWGRSASFSLAGDDVGVSLFVGRPGALSTFPGDVDAPDPELLSALAHGRGAILLDGEGQTALLDQFTYEVEIGSDLEDPPAPSDGGLFASPDGTVFRLAWEEEQRAERYDPGEDVWSTLAFSAAPGSRPDAAMLVDPGDTTVYVLGGGEEVDAVAISLSLDPEGELPVVPVLDLELDDPRRGATAVFVGYQDDLTADAIVVGGTDVPLVFVTSSLQTAGDVVNWTHAACRPLDDPATVEAGEVVRVLCVGGLVDDAPTADAVVVTLDAGAVEIATHAEFLPAAMAHPFLLEDESALYAQGEGLLVRIDREDLERTSDENALRARAGSTVTLSTGATFLLGGLAEDDTPLDRWQVFMPTLGSD